MTIATLGMSLPTANSTPDTAPPPVGGSSALSLSLARSIIVDEDAYLFNTASFDQDKVVTAGDFQYVGYWNGDGRLTLARRHLVTNGIERITFPDEISPRVDDGHRNVVLGISTGDGRLHLSYDHHVDQLRYRYSQADFLTDPPSSISVDDFSPRTSMLDDPSLETGVTYPRFFADRDGELYFMYRRGSAGDGNKLLHRHDSRTNTWTRIGLLFSGEGVYPPGNDSTSRNAYVDYPSFDADNRLHITWTYREGLGTGQAGNHDVHYAYSDDSGVTWFNNDGVQVADLEAGDPIAIDDPSLAVVAAPLNSWLMNQTAMAIGPDGEPHVFQQRSTVVVEEFADRNYHMIHYWRTPDGKWHEQYIDDTTLRQPGLVRGDLAFDAAGDLHVYFASHFVDGLWAARATQNAGWTDWQTYKIAEVAPQPTGDGNVFDRYRWKRDGVLSVPVGLETEDGAQFALLEFTTRARVPGHRVELDIDEASAKEVTLVWRHVVGADRFDLHRSVEDAGFELVADDIGLNSMLPRGEPGAWVQGFSAYVDDIEHPEQTHAYRLVARSGERVIGSSPTVRVTPEE